MKHVEPRTRNSSARKLIPGLPLLLLASCGAPPGEEPAADGPNIVILVSDDQDYEHFGFAGHPLAHTPIIDRLAREGFTFTHAFVPMSRCRPAQAALLGGEWPHQSNVYYNVGADHIDPQTSLANLLGDAGYETVGEGKFWEYDPRLMGFSNYTIRNYETFGREGQEHLFRWLDDNHGERPFFLWWAPELPHVPHNPPERLLALFDRDAIEVPPWIEGDPEVFREDEHKSLAMEAWLDECVGQLEDKLEELGELEDTLFLFLIDNGYANGLPSKGTAFDKGLRTPAIFTWRGGIEASAEGRTSDELVDAVDLYATLLDYGGARQPSHTPGVSLRPIIGGDETKGPRETLYGAIYLQAPAESNVDPARDAFGLWARDKRWKYVLYLEDVRAAEDKRFKIQANHCAYPERDRGDEELFDLDQDPYELRNLAHDPEQRERCERLRKEILDWWEQSGGGPLDLP